MNRCLPSPRRASLAVLLLCSLTAATPSAQEPASEPKAVVPDATTDSDAAVDTARQIDPAHSAADAAGPPGSDYPTAVIADYVLGCMAANGNSYIALHQCSCSIDYIRARMPYDVYERASTVMQVQYDRGQRGLFYRDSSWAKQRVEELENVQAQSTLECF